MILMANMDFAVASNDENTTFLMIIITLYNIEMSILRISMEIF